MVKKDRDKLEKAGYATPRGGKKGAYQNHVGRSNRVILPYEKLSSVDLRNYQDGYIIRLFPEQYFDAAYNPKQKFINGVDSWIIVGINAFVLYRTHIGKQTFPPLPNWSLRGLEKDGKIVNSRRTKNVTDTGHFVQRIPRIGEFTERIEGVDQGVFAPEYADQTTNYLSQCVLAWLIVHTVGSPYVTTQTKHLQAILAQNGLLGDTSYEYKGVMRHGLCSCPLCLRLLSYEELHKMVSFNEDSVSDNAADQVEGATRSTIVNLFHLEPLVYDRIDHVPANVAWGHHSCNSRLGQRRCRSLRELMDLELKVGIITPEGIESFGWISDDYEMIRSPLGSVWIRISTDGDLDELPKSEDILIEDPDLGTGTLLELEEQLAEKEQE
ncbi:BstXI restriction endonuclease [Kamptonema sp. PCC 6506]|nr:BstXI restriction endonuclease [Kamptonema sp. PCC 6506]